MAATRCLRCGTFYEPWRDRCTDCGYSDDGFDELRAPESPARHPAPVARPETLAERVDRVDRTITWSIRLVLMAAFLGGIAFAPLHTLAACVALPLLWWLLRRV
jgi:hypothetical protein